MGMGILLIHGTYMGMGMRIGLSNNYSHITELKHMYQYLHTPTPGHGLVLLHTTSQYYNRYSTSTLSTP